MSDYPQQFSFLAQRLLQAVQGGFARHDVALPDRQLLYAGVSPPVDFDDPDATVPGMLAIGMGPLSPGTPGALTTGQPVMPEQVRRAAQLRVWLFRPCSALGDNGQLPTPEDMTADALVVFTDAMVLLDGIEAARTDWTLVARRADYAIGQVQPVTVAGGYAGITTTVDVDLIDPDGWA